MEAGDITGESNKNNDDKVYLCKSLVKHVHNSTHLETSQIVEIKETIMLLVKNITAKTLDNIQETKHSYFDLVIQPEI